MASPTDTDFQLFETAFLKLLGAMNVSYEAQDERRTHALDAARWNTEIQTMPTPTTNTIQDPNIYIPDQILDKDDVQVLHKLLDETLEAKPISPPFQMRQNTQEIEIRELDTRYPRQIHRQNYQVSYIIELMGYRLRVKNAIRRIREINAAREAIIHCRHKHRENLKVMMATIFIGRDLRYITSDITEPNTRPEDAYDSALVEIDNYRGLREMFINNKKEYSSLQAEYNQRAAMIRQRPEKPVHIQTQEIINTVSSWDNVWGVSTYEDTFENKLHIRVGLCDITMKEAAMDSRYDDAKDIMLAPLYFKYN